MAAEEAGIAGRGVQRDDPVSLEKSGHALSNLFHNAGSFMAEEDRRLQHQGMVTAPVNFQIGAAGERSAYPNQQLSRLRTRNRHPLQSQVLFTVQYRCRHLRHILFYFLTLPPEFPPS